MVNCPRCCPGFVYLMWGVLPSAPFKFKNDPEPVSLDGHRQIEVKAKKILEPSQSAE